MDNPKYVVNDEDQAGPSLGYLIIEEDFNIALGVFASWADLLDGFIAENWASQKSALESALDPQK